MINQSIGISLDSYQLDGSSSSPGRRCFRLETKSGRILPFTYATKYDLT